MTKVPRRTTRQETTATAHIIAESVSTISTMTLPPTCHSRTDQRHSPTNPSSPDASLKHQYHPDNASWRTSNYTTVSLTQTTTSVFLTKTDGLYPSGATCSPKHSRARHGYGSIIYPLAASTAMNSWSRNFHCISANNVATSATKAKSTSASAETPNR